MGCYWVRPLLSAPRRVFGTHIYYIRTSLLAIPRASMRIAQATQRKFSFSQLYPNGRRPDFVVFQSSHGCLWHQHLGPRNEAHPISSPTACILQLHGPPHRVCRARRCQASPNGGRQAQRQPRFPRCYSRAPRLDNISYESRPDKSTGLQYFCLCCYALGCILSNT
jgi:hypothetical protein